MLDLADSLRRGIIGHSEAAILPMKRSQKSDALGSGKNREA